MYTILQQIFPYAVGILWLGGIVGFFWCARAKQRAYLKHFPPVEGVPLDMYVGGNPFGTVSRAIWRAMLQRQSDPDLEQLRRKGWRCTLYQILWSTLFPIFAIGVVALLIATGVVRPT